MPNLEWEVAHDLVTPGGTIPLNQTEMGTGYHWLIQPEGYKIVPSLRAVLDNLSQGDGSVLHPRWKTGLVASLKVEYRVDPGGGVLNYACAKDLRVMHERFTKALNSIRRLTQNQQRFVWSPTNDTAISRRMMDFVQCLAWVDPTHLLPGVDVAFALESPLPYAIDLTQVTTPLPATITNPGTSDHNPVLKVHGPFSAFTITNTSVLDPFGNPLAIVYDSTRPGASAVAGGSYAEIDTFRGTVFLNGSSSDLTAGLDPALTDFWPLQPGANAVTMSGAPSCDVFWNPAWS